MAPQGSLIAGLSQWVGVSVVAKHDEVHEASISVSGLGAPATPASESSTVLLRLQLKEDSYITELDSPPGADLTAGNFMIHWIPCATVLSWFGLWVKLGQWLSPNAA